MPNSFKEITIKQEQDGQRLDNVIALIFPDLSLRERRKLWDDWKIFVDNKVQGAGFRVRVGQVIRLEAKNLTVAPTIQQGSDNSATLQASILKVDNDFIFLYKPQGLHSTMLNAGGPSLEGQLANLLGSEYESVKLCNRLDVQTSGIVVAGKNDAARLAWQSLENYAKCQKRYVALVQESEQGLAKSCVIKTALDTDKRKKSRVLAEDTHSLRHTHFNKLAVVDAATYAILCEYFPNFPKNMPQGLFFMGCTIFKGARHQIRAHAAHAGFALFNDHRYIDANPNYENESFLLHHGALNLPHDSIYCSAPWEQDLPQKVQEIINQFFTSSCPC